VPFCDGKCAYCAFYSVRFTPAAADGYLDALAREMDLARREAGALAPETIYIGGGTPSALGADRLRRLCGMVRRGVDAAAVREWTVEANPGTLTEQKAAALREAGVTRVSLGAQSFDDAVLRRAGRRHQAGDIPRSAALLRAAGFGNIGLDLIAGLPGADAASWRATLRRAVALRPTHLSVYPLSVEEGTRLHALVRGGAEILPGEPAVRLALAAAERELGAAGFERYEISNYARLPGTATATGAEAASPWRCLHNTACWQGDDYLGLGPAACSRLGLRRRANRPDLRAYVRELRAGRPPPRDAERVSPSTDASERLMFGFRLREGVDLAEFARRFGKAARSMAPAWGTALRRLAREGAVERAGTRWSLTARGREVADYVAGELLPDGRCMNRTGAAGGGTPLSSACAL
jgi:oxygen-independent coproporphyrinogen-3 oxidase